ncbi:hypothetical protein QWM81_06665 [Streptomyces ficellus]|uniref:Secreted protein n=1 Tax=Streptomyces ficellus TaxID=1977088 RepID=A0ABT7Z2Q4_9ACTN|nr:hypothetical protein [Streptomyces ficellus]MDN3293731.1 hypothetical protein [Streptomyces ficellus]
MRSIRTAAVALAGGATLLALSAAPAQATTPATPATPRPDVTLVDCGTGWNGLSVVAVTTKGSSACGTAHRVADAYGKAVEAKDRKVVIVHVDGTAWKCRERHGDPNPYTECVKLKDRTEKVKLLS